MKLIFDYLCELTRATIDGWNRFWFTPSDVATLAVMRICAGLMLLYTHLVWTLEFDAFLGPAGFIPEKSAAAFYEAVGSSISYAPSILWYVRSPAALWVVHLAGLVAMAMFTLGLFTRVAAVATFVAALSYVNRLPGALFGLDQINVMLATYLMLAPCGDAYSLDRLRAARRAGGPLPPAAPTVMSNVAVRLIQLHMCIIYFFSGLGKLQGDMWWYGDALWGAVANMEYQTVNLTWLADYPILTALLTQATAYWELAFCALVWPRVLRPLVVFIALPLHLGIGICLGLMTFGLVMPIGVMSFVSPTLVRRLLDRDEADVSAEQGRGGGDASPLVRGLRRAVRRAS